MPSAAARAPSSSGAVEAPVQTLMRKPAPDALASEILLARASGTSFGYPAPVNPLIPTVAPGRMRAAASSAGTTFRRRPACWIRPLVVTAPTSLERRRRTDAPAPRRARTVATRIRAGPKPARHCDRGRNFHRCCSAVEGRGRLGERCAPLKLTGTGNQQWAGSWAPAEPQAWPSASRCSIGRGRRWASGPRCAATRCAASDRRCGVPEGFVEVPGWTWWQNAGAGLTVADLDGNGGSDLVVLTVDDPEGRNAAYYRIGAGFVDGVVTGGWGPWWQV